MMVRQNYKTNPADKLFEMYYSFTGGMNTTTSYENMTDYEVLQLLNYDLVERGPVRRRFGMVKHIQPPVEGKGQGYFRFYKNETEYDEIIAVGGNLYKNGATLTITGLPTGFQATRPIEAVQFQDKLWIATGTKLVEYDGTTAKVVEAYKPQPLDALYIGTNGLADDPNNYMTDGEALSMRIDGVTFSKRYGIINQPVTLTAYHSIPSGMSVEYLFEYRYPTMADGTWYEGQAWSSSKTWEYTPKQEGDVQFRIGMRETGLEVAEATYLVPKFKVNATTDAAEAEIKVDYLNECNRIILHWNRLIMWGDSTQPDALYISHLNNPRYFPVPNSLRLENGRNERITTLVPYRDMLVGFTPTTIQAIYGTSPFDFKRITLNTTIGCIAPETAKVFRNHVYFLSYDGVYKLKSVGYTEDKANVEKVDTRIANLIPRDTNACASVHEGQYQILFPNSNTRFRCYVDMDEAWVMDESPKLDFHAMRVIDNELYGQSSSSGRLMKFKKDVFNDDGHIYQDIIETKGFNFGQPYHVKKLKEIQVMTSPKEGDINARLYVYADNQPVLSPDTSHAVVDAETGEVSWVPQFEINFEARRGTKFGEWTMGESPFGDTESSIAKLPLTGKCYTARMKFVHEEDRPSVLLGLAYIFKLKRP